MPNDRHRADQAVTLPRKPPISICILNEAIVGTPSDAQQPFGRLTPCWVVHSVIGPALGNVL
jgi:hypothetical protein